jgi:hypothetical protein
VARIHFPNARSFNGRRWLGSIKGGLARSEILFPGEVGLAGDVVIPGVSGLEGESRFVTLKRGVFTHEGLTIASP